jgi:hypothetical protein
MSRNRAVRNHLFDGKTRCQRDVVKRGKKEEGKTKRRLIIARDEAIVPSLIYIWANCLHRSFIAAY